MPAGERVRTLRSPIEAATASLMHNNPANSNNLQQRGSPSPPPISDIRKQIENKMTDNEMRSRFGFSAVYNNQGGGKKKSATEQKRSEANAAHRLEFMRKIEEGKITLEGSSNPQQACVFQQLDVSNDLLEEFARMNFSPSDFDNAAIGKRNANTRRIVIPLATTDHSKVSLSGSTSSASGISGILGTSDPMSKKAISSEYAARYCEMLNVTPSSRNLALIQKKIPLKSCTVSNLYNAGQARNNIVIEPSKVDVKFKEDDTTDDIVYKLLSAETITASETVNEDTDPNSPYRKGVISAAHVQNAEFMRTAKNRNVIDTHDIAKFPTFDSYKYRFVFPWNVDDKDVSGDKAFGILRKRAFAPKVFDIDDDDDDDTTAPEEKKTKDTISVVVGDDVQSENGDDDKDDHTTKQLDRLDKLLAKGAAIVRGEKVTTAPTGSTILSSRTPHVAQNNSESTINNDDSREGHSRNVTSFCASSAAAANASKFKFSPQDAVNAAIHKELTATIIMSDTAEIQSLLRQFIGGFPWQKLVDRIHPNVIASIQRFIRSSAMVTVCLELSNLLYCAYIRPYTASVPSMSIMQQEDLFLRIASALNTTIRSEDGIEHALRLLAIRVTILAEFTSHLPLFSTCEIGEGIKQSIDTIITSVGDPTGLVSRICVFESTPQALRMIRHKRLPKMNIFNVKSPLALLLLEKAGDATSSSNATTVAAAKTFASEIAELRRFVSPRIRQQLLSIVRSAHM